MSLFWKVVAALAGGLLLAFIASMVVALSGLSDEGSAVSVVFWVAWLAGAVIALLSHRAARAWRYILVGCAILSLTMPLASMIFAGSQVVESGAMGAGAAAGSAIGGGIVTAMSGVVGFFMAAIFLIIGLLVGKDRPAA